MRFRFIDSDGTEQDVPDVPALVNVIRDGTLRDDHLLFDERTGRWEVAAKHDVFLVASAANYRVEVPVQPDLTTEDDTHSDTSELHTSFETPTEPPHLETAQLSCPSCDRHVAADARFCASCGEATTSTAAEPRTWWVQQEGQELGPFTRTELQAAFNEGRLAPNVLVKSPDMLYWLPAGSLPAFDITGESAHSPTEGTLSESGPQRPAWPAERFSHEEEEPVRPEREHGLAGKIYIGLVYVASGIWGLMALFTLFAYASDDFALGVFLAVVFGTVAYFFYRLARGLSEFRSWARVVALILLWIGVLGGVLSFFTIGTDPASAIAGVITGAINALFIRYFLAVEEDFAG